MKQSAIVNDKSMRNSAIFDQYAPVWVKVSWSSENAKKEIQIVLTYLIYCFISEINTYN
jgi:hypothetical protein